MDNGKYNSNFKIHKSFLQHEVTFPLIALFCYIVIVFILAIVPTAGGYEYSVYSAYPPILWLLVIFLLVLPLFYIFISVKGYLGLQYQKKTIWWLVIISFMTLILMLYMPLIRGDVIHYSGDTLHHLGVIYDLMQNGYLYAGNQYPFVHVLGAEFTLVLGVARTVVSHNLIPIFSALFILGVFCCARSLHLPHYSVMAITTFSIIPVIPWITIEGIMPSTIGLQLLPLFIFLVWNVISKDKIDVRYTLLTVLFIILLWFVHPEITPCASVFVVLALSIVCVSKLTKRSKFPFSFYLMGVFLVFQVVGYIFFIASTSYSGFIGNTLNALFNNLFSGMGPDSPAVGEVPGLDNAPTVNETPVVGEIPTVGDVSSTESSIFTIGESSVPFIDRAIGTIDRWIGYLITFSLTGISILYGFKQKLFKHPIYSLAVITFMAYCLVSLAGMIGNYEMFGIERLLKYPLLFAIFICGFTFADLLSAKSDFKFKKVFTMVFIIALIMSATFSVFMLYGNPSLSTHNKHTTYQDVSGMELFYTYSDKNTLVVENGFREHQERYMKYLYGVSATMKNIRGTFGDDIIVPYHLGYDTEKYFGDVYDSQMYYLKYPPNEGYQPFMTGTLRYPARVYSTDYHHLDYDNTTQRIQTGGDLEVYITSPTK